MKNSMQFCVRSDLADERKRAVYLKAVYGLTGDEKKAQDMDAKIKAIDDLSREGIKKIRSCIRAEK